MTAKDLKLDYFKFYDVANREVDDLTHDVGREIDFALRVDLAVRRDLAGQILPLDLAEGHRSNVLVAA